MAFMAIFRLIIKQLKHKNGQFKELSNLTISRTIIIQGKCIIMDNSKHKITKEETYVSSTY